MRLNLNEIDREINEAVADGETLVGLRTGEKIRIRAPYSSRSRRHASESNSSGRRSWKEKEKEGSF